MSVASPTSSPSFDLHALVAAVCDGNPKIANPADLADLVLDKINQSDYRDALRQTLRQYVTGYITRTRVINHHGGAGASTLSPSPGPGGTPAATTGTTRKVGRSRLSGIADLLNSREYSWHRGDWISLSDATEADLRSIANNRGEIAATYLTNQRWYDGLADLLVKYRVSTFGELPTTVQAAVASGTLP